MRRLESFTVIAARLGKAVSTVSREVAANRGRGGYRAWRAHQRARQQARRPKTPKLACPRLAAQVTGWLADWRSPQQIPPPVADRVPRRSHDVGEPRDHLSGAVCAGPRRAAP
jgi:IS30 family transposase